MSSFLQLQCASTAMQMVVQEHAPAEMRAQLEQQRQENERLRMQVEELRQAQFWNGQTTWRELSHREHRTIVHLHHEVIEPALDILEGARRDIRMLSGTPAYTPDLVQAYNTMCDAEQRLRNEDSEDMSEDSEEGQEDEVEEE